MGVGYIKNIQVDTLAKQTTENLTYYVSATGSDTNDGLTAETAFATVQYALGIIPTNIKHIVTINIGEGNFAGFMVTGFIVSQNCYITINGTLGVFAPATGIASGTADGSGGSTSVLSDADAGWTTNNLRGALLHIGTEWRIIRDNTASTITVVGTFAATCNSKAYEIVEQKTVINTSSPYSTTGYVVMVDGNSGARNGIRLADFRSDSNAIGMFARGACIRCDRLKATQQTTAGYCYEMVTGEPVMYDCCAKSTVAGSTSYGAVFLRGTTGTLSRLFVYDSTFLFGLFSDSCTISAVTDWHVYNNTRNSSYGILFQGISTLGITGTNSVINQSGTGCFGFACYCCDYVKCTGTITVNGVAGAGTFGFGMYMVGPLQANLHTITITGCSGHGIECQRGATMMTITASITSNGGYGVDLRGHSEFLFRTGTSSVASNTLGGVWVREGSYMLLDNTDGSNTGYGIVVETGGRVTIDTQTGITGTTNNILLDDVAKTYAGDFGTNKNAVIGVAGSVVQRYDGLDYI